MIKKITPEEEYEDPNDFYTFKEANRYDLSNGMKRMQEELTSILLNYSEIKLNKSSFILDIGCGTGFYIDYLKSLGYTNVIGIDPAREMVNLARRKKLDILLGGFLDLKDLPIEKNYFDFIISVSALQWVISNKEEMEIKNTIKKIGGCIYNFLSKNGVCAIQFYPKDEIIFEVVASSFERCNLNVKRVIYNNSSPKKRKFILILHKNN